jgi:hypothetical protein
MWTNSKIVGNVIIVGNNFVLTLIIIYVLEIQENALKKQSILKKEKNWLKKL